MNAPLLNAIGEVQILAAFEALQDFIIAEAQRREMAGDLSGALPYEIAALRVSIEAADLRERLQNVGARNAE